MPRTRDIKPGFFKNEELARCDPLARILFEGLWCWCDKVGRLEDRPLRLKAEILPYDNVDADLLLGQLQERGFILRYEVDRYKCIQIVSWGKNGNPHPNEPEFELPAPPEGLLPGIVTSNDKSRQVPFNSNLSFNFNPPGGERVKPEKLAMPEIPESLGTAEFRRAWTEWLAYRDERKPHVTPRSAAMAFRKLQEIGPERAVAAIEHSIANGYQGVVEPGGWARTAPAKQPVKEKVQTVEELRKRLPPEKPSPAKGGSP